MINWDDLRYFLAVERGRTLAAAAARLGVDATTVGRRIDRLAASLNTSLFEVGPRGHTLTPSGKRLLTHAEEMERSLLSASGDLSGERSRYAGTVRISMSEGFATWVVAPQLPQFHARHPDISLEIVTTNGFLNPSKREADMAVMLARPSRGALLSRKLADYRLGLFASQDYIHDHGAVRDIEDLRTRTLIGYIPDFIYADELRYLHEVDVQLTPNFASSSINVQHSMVRGGTGVAILPNFIGLNDPVLVPQLAETVMVQRSFWVVVHRDLRGLARVSAVMEWLQQAVHAVTGPQPK